MPVARADNENANENENGKTGKCGKQKKVGILLTNGLFIFSFSDLQQNKRRSNHNKIAF